MQIGLLQIFVEINFVDQGFSLAMPTFVAACTICAHSRNNATLGCSLPNSSAFVQGQTSSRAFSALFVGAYQLRISSRRCLPIDKRNAVEGTYDADPQELEALALKQRWSATLLLTSTQ